MSPDEKYMAQNSETTANINEEFNFMPFLEKMGIKNMSMGLIPVFFPMTTQPFVPQTMFPQSMSPQPIPTQPMNTVEQPSAAMLQALREFDLDLNEDEDLSREPQNRVDRILNYIERNNPGAFSLLYAYRVPPPIARLIIRRIIRLTLEFCKDNR
jgi:hypothetical protein